jgi:hypothetical protein
MANGGVAHLAGLEWAPVQANLALLWIGSYALYFIALEPKGGVSLHHHHAIVLKANHTITTSSLTFP